MIDVSVIIPVYNAEKTIKRCLDSVIAQKRCSWQIICIDDASNDNSREIICQYISTDKRIKLISNPVNIGAALSRNIGLDNAIGKYIMNLDADDFLSPNSLEGLLNYVLSNEVDMCFYKANYIFMDDKANKNIPRGIMAEYNHVYQGRELFDIFLTNSEFFYYCWSVIYKRSYLKERNLYYKKIVIGEGGDFIIRALYYANQATVYSQCVYNYCVHENSVTNSSTYKIDLLIGRVVQYASMLKLMMIDYSVMAEKFLVIQKKMVAGSVYELSCKDIPSVRRQFTSDFERAIFDTFTAYKKSFDLIFDKEDIKKIKSFPYIYIYGIGYAATECLCRLSDMGININGFVISRESKRTLYGHKVLSIDEVPTEANKSLFVICANSKYSQEIIKTLHLHRFFYYIDLNITF
ncbi:glycosyltransferase family 2 protein [Selenomonas ruminantium]|uniref:glycosyltransferase family 2 protein n=1 Tax=Selenomonas ruminantium TaxID=971 RepID=UPI00041F9A35|nr:glycosyltransferase family 2 protein [Selenomonas ruminantium]